VGTLTRGTFITFVKTMALRVTRNFPTRTGEKRPRETEVENKANRFPP